MTKRAVSQFNPDTGALVATYESMVEAETETGISRQNIRGAVVNSHQHLAGGFIWTDLSPETFIPPTREQIEQMRSENIRNGKIGHENSEQAIEKIRQASMGKTHSNSTLNTLVAINENKRENAPKPVYQYTLPDLRYVATHQSIKSAAKHAGVASKTMRQVLSSAHPTWITTKNHHWSYDPPTELNRHKIQGLLRQSPRFQSTPQ